MYSAHFFVNTDAIVAGAKQIGDTFGNSYLIQSHVTSFVRQVIYSEFQAACEIGNSEDGFPPEFQNHLMGAVSKIEPDVFVDLHGVTISFDLEEHLGGYDDLQKAFHQGAKLAGGGELSGPYTGQELHQEDAETRHIFWEALRFGHSKAQIGDKSVPVKGSWDQTVEKYIEIWGAKAPEWLFLQFGQEEWAPYVPQIDVVNNIENAVHGGLASYLGDVFQKSIETANKFRSTGLEVGYTGPNTIRVISGSYTDPKTGKTYRPGRFAPRGGIK